MYADRFDAKRGVEPRSLMLAVGINGAVLLAIATAAPDLVTQVTNHPFIGYPVPVPPPPKPLPKPVQRDPRPSQAQPTTTDQIIKTPPTTIDLTLTNHDMPPIDTDHGIGTGQGLGGTTIDPPPVFIDAAADPRYADALQPPYPPDEQRMGREGRVVVRVLIGTDGRVHDVVLVSAASESFFAITRRQALTKWRFRPATRGGVAVETWRQMAVSFHLRDVE